MIACAPTIRPPAPMPCTARKTISCVSDPLAPDSAEPIRKITMAMPNSFLRP